MHKGRFEFAIITAQLSNTIRALDRAAYVTVTKIRKKFEMGKKHSTLLKQKNAFLNYNETD
jgi:hypothetical protein